MRSTSPRSDAYASPSASQNTLGCRANNRPIHVSICSFRCRTEIVSQPSLAPSKTSLHSLPASSRRLSGGEISQSIPANPTARRNSEGASASPSRVCCQCWTLRLCSASRSHDCRHRSAGRSLPANRRPKQEAGTPWPPFSRGDSDSKPESRDASRASSASRRFRSSPADTSIANWPDRHITESAARRGRTESSLRGAGRDGARSPVAEMSGRSANGAIWSSVSPAPNRPRAIHSIRSTSRRRWSSWFPARRWRARSRRSSETFMSSHCEPKNRPSLRAMMMRPSSSNHEDRVTLMWSAAFAAPLSGSAARYAASQRARQWLSAVSSTSGANRLRFQAPPSSLHGASLHGGASVSAAAISSRSCRIVGCWRTWRMGSGKRKPSRRSRRAALSVGKMIGSISNAS